MGRAGCTLGSMHVCSVGVGLTVCLQCDYSVIFSANSVAIETALESAYKMHSALESAVQDALNAPR